MARILFVEDDALVRHGISRALAGAGHEVRACSTQFDALQTADSFDLELALLDIGLPDSSGVACARALRAKGFTGAIVFLTADAEPAQVQHALSVAPQAYLVKPLTSTQLLPAIETALVAARTATGEKTALLSALHNSREISSAVGMLAERHGWTTEAAFEALRKQARARGLPITAVAGQVIAARGGTSEDADLPT